MVCQEPTSTPTGMSRPLPFAASSAATAVLSNASAPMPYTVSVGITTSRPPLSAPTAVAIPAERCSGSAQLNTSVTGAPPTGRHESCPPGQISSSLDIFEKPRPLDQFDGARGRGVIVLDGEQAAGAQPASGEADHRVDHRHPAGATEHRVRWIMLGDF